MKGNGYDIVAGRLRTSPTWIPAAAPSPRCTPRWATSRVLVNNAGITRDMTFKKMDKVNWDAVMRTNLDSLFNMS